MDMQSAQKLGNQSRAAERLSAAGLLIPPLVENLQHAYRLEPGIKAPLDSALEDLAKLGTDIAEALLLLGQLIETPA